MAEFVGAFSCKAPGTTAEDLFSALDTEKQNIYTYISSNIIPSRKEAVRATDKVRIPDLHCEEAISQGQELEMGKYMQSS